MGGGRCQSRQAAGQERTLPLAVLLNSQQQDLANIFIRAPPPSAGGSPTVPRDQGQVRTPAAATQGISRLVPSIMPASLLAFPHHEPCTAQTPIHLFIHSFNITSERCRGRSCEQDKHGPSSSGFNIKQKRQTLAGSGARLPGSISQFGTLLFVSS